MATVISSQPRHVLTPLSPKKRTALGNITNIARGLATATANNAKGLGFSNPPPAKQPLGVSITTRFTKRPFSNDENSTSQVKRMKSQTSSSSCEDSTIPKYALVTKPLSAVPSGLVLSKKNNAQGPLKRRTHGLSSSSASTIGSSGRSAVHSSALSRKDSLASLTATSPSKGIKRKAQKVANLAKSGNAIDTSNINGRLVATPVAKSGITTANTWRPGQSFPSSWSFDIHEDTLEETLTNLMYHGAGVLDISDEEDEKKKGMSEVDRVGKENIPPLPTQDELAMPPPPAPAPASTRTGQAEMDAERTRNPLGDVDVEVFYPTLKEEREKAKETKQKSKGLMQSKFAAIDEIVTDYMKQNPTVSEEVPLAAEVPLPAEEDDLESTKEAPVVSKAELKVSVPTISVDNCDFDNVIDSQTRSMAEDELFDDDL